MIKAQYTQIHELLLANKGKKLTVKLLDELTALMESKNRAKTFKLDKDGNVTHIFCYYHKEWEDVSEVPYGKKASTAHGLNTMCKQGTSNWTKQQRVLKQTKADLLNQIADGSLAQEELPGLLAQAEEQAKEIKHD